MTVAAYSAADMTACLEPVAVGDTLPGLPLFLGSGLYVPAPVETSYQLTWDKCPRPLQEVVEAPAVD